MTGQYQPCSVEDWFKATTGSPPDIAQKASEEAVAFFKNELTNDAAKKEWVTRQHSLEDALQVAHDAEERYRSRHSKLDKAYNWATRLSKHLLYYSPVLDTLSQHHPTYTAIGWGALKFVLMGTVEHAAQFSKISEALVAIGEVLPRTRLYIDLYPTHMITEALYKLYAYMLLFLMKATRWYSFSRSRQAVHALLHPYEITYKDTVEQISRCTQCLDTLAGAANKAEQRSIAVAQTSQWYLMETISARLTDMYKDFQAMQSLVKSTDTRVDHIMKTAHANYTLSTEIKLDTSDGRRRMVDLQGARVRDELKSVGNPHRQLLKGESIARRRQSWRFAASESENMVRLTTRWATSTASSLLILQAGTRAEPKARDLAIDIIRLVQAAGKKVIWTISPTSDSDNARSLTTLFQMLVSQILDIVPKSYSQVLSRWDICDIKGEFDETWWKSAFSELASKLAPGFIVVDAEELFRDRGRDTDWIIKFLLIFQRLVETSIGPNSSLKVLVIVYSTSPVLVSGLPKTPHRLIGRIRHSMPPPPRLRRGGRQGQQGFLGRNLLPRRDWK